VVDQNFYIVIAASDGAEVPARIKAGPFRLKAGCCPDSTQIHYAVQGCSFKVLSTNEMCPVLADEIGFTEGSEYFSLVQNVATGIYTVSLKEQYAKQVDQSYTYTVSSMADGGSVSILRRNW